MRRFQEQNFAPKPRLLLSIKTSFDFRPDSTAKFNEALILNVYDVIPRLQANGVNAECVLCSEECWLAKLAVTVSSERKDERPARLMIQ